VAEPQHPIYLKFIEILKAEHPEILEYLEVFQVREIQENTNHLHSVSYLWFSHPSARVALNPSYYLALAQIIGRIDKTWSIAFDYGLRSELLDAADSNFTQES
jgi:hypothetical protein